MTDTPAKAGPTGAYFGQAIASFAIALVATALGILRLEADAWVRGFLAVAVLFLVTSAFTLAKVIRDRQEADQLINRVDQARVDKLLAANDPFH